MFVSKKGCETIGDFISIPGGENDNSRQELLMFQKEICIGRCWVSSS